MPDAETIFLKKNLLLLAEKYNVSSAQAQVIQARLYNNPNVQMSGNIYNPELKKPFDMSNAHGEFTVGIQQLIDIAGKHNSQVKVAQTSVALAQSRLFDLLRTLRYTLRSDYYQLYFLQQSIHSYDEQIEWLGNMSKTYDDLAAKGRVSLKDAMRIKSLWYGLKAEQLNLQTQFNEVEAEFQLLLQVNNTVLLPDTVKQQVQDIKQLPMQSLLDSAYTHRYDLLQAQQTATFAAQNYTLQKATAVPDLLIGASFDKRGSFVENAGFFTVGIDLPFFNRNQGNIKAAKLGIEQSKLLVNQQQQVVENDVLHAYQDLLAADAMVKSIDTSFPQQFTDLLKSAQLNFQKNNLSVLDFTDFYESYKQSVLQYNQALNNKAQSIERLNFAVGAAVLSY